MNYFPSNVKQKLNSIIQDMSDHHCLFTQNPSHDFSRQHLGKLSFYDTMLSMLSHFSPDEPEKYIITVDRGYESYDLIFQCELKKLNYVFRLKAPSSGRSILSSFSSEIPDDQEEFDVTVKRFFTDKYNKIMKEQGDVYHYMNPYKTIPHFHTFFVERYLVEHFIEHLAEWHCLLRF